MPANDSYDYAVIRVVPRVERGEYVNAGVVLFCRTQRYLVAKVELGESRLLALDPGVDVDAVREALAVLTRIAAGEAGAGPIAALPAAERFYWLTAPRSTVVQPSPIHSGRGDPAAAVDRLMDEMVR